MNANAYVKVDKATFFRFIERQTEGRFEYEDGRIVQQMSGGTLDHMRIVQRFVSALEQQLDLNVWVVTSQGRGVETAKTVRYPDVVVEALGAAGKGLSTEKPVVIIEVLSSTTQVLDFNTKPLEYLALEALEVYVVASQDGPECWIWRRGPDRRFPEMPERRAGPDSAIDVATPRVMMPLEAIYRGIGGQPAG